jgi:hypothetical protein
VRGGSYKINGIFGCGGREGKPKNEDVRQKSFKERRKG